MGKIEPRSGQGRRLVTDQGDIPISTHLLTMMAYTWNPEGGTDIDWQARWRPAGSGAVDWHVRDSDGGDYIVVAPARYAKNGRRGGVHHVELDLQVVAGGT